MTDKEKIRISKTELFKLRGVCSQLEKLYDTRDGLIMSLYGTGIDYSKDRIQTSPVNMMEEAFAITSEIDQKIDELIETRNRYVQRIYNMKRDMSVNLLIDIYRNRRSYRSIAYELGVSESTVYERQERALIEYFNTNYSVGIATEH